MRPSQRSLRHGILLFFCALALIGCSKEPSEEQKQADVMLAKAKTVLARWDYRQGRELLKSAILLDRDLGRASKVAEEERLLGGAYASAAIYDSALQSYNLAAEQYRNLADRQSVRDVTLEIAASYRQMGEERKAFELYTEAYRLAKVFGDDAGAVTIQWAMLPCCVALEARSDVRRVLADLLAAATASKDAGQQALVYYESGVSKFLQGSYEPSRQELLRSITLADGARDSLLAARALLRLAVTYSAAGMNQEAFRTYSDGLRRADRLRNDPLRHEMLTRVGNIYLRLHRFSDAAKFYRAGLSAAINSGSKIGEGYSFIQLGHCDLDLAPSSALRSYRSALDLFQGLAYAPGSAYALYSLGIAAKRANQFTEAVTDFQSAVEQSEASSSHRRGDDLYLECEHAYTGPRRYPAYDELIKLLIQAGRYDEAFRYVERKNRREMYDELNGMDPVAAENVLNDALSRFNDDRAMRIGAERQLARALTSGPLKKDLLSELHEVLDADANSMKGSGEALVAVNSAFAPYAGVGNVGLGEIQKALPPGAVLVEPVAVDRSLYTFVVTGSRSAVEVAAITRDSVVAMTRELSDALRRREQRTDSLETALRMLDRRIQDLTASLYQAFVRPIEADIAGTTSLLVVLPSEAAALPLHALRRSPYGNAKYVVEQTPVSYLPYAGALLLQPVPPSAPRDVVGVGFAGETSWDVEYELRDIRAFFKEARLYFGQQATLSTLQKEHGDVLHLAAEFHPDEYSPGNAYLNLSDGESPEGTKQIPFGELFSLPASRAIVISDLADHPAGINRSEVYPFLASGTRMVVLNEYVPSRKTKKYFGEVFYTALLAGESDRSAFRKAQLAMIANPEFAAPYAWAPFFVWGK